MRTSHLLTLLLSVLVLAGCADNLPSFSLLPDENYFHQNADETNGKIDVLWVVDNSYSMLTSQQAVASNFRSFIEKFTDKGFDFQMAVTTSDAYLSIFNNNPELSRFRDGAGSKHSGYFVMTPDTPNLTDVFMTNIIQGVNGNGDERAFQSMKEALNNSLNSGFLRDGAFLAVIIVSDEDDFSHDSSDFMGGQYSSPTLHTVQSYVDYFDGLTKSSSSSRNYNINAISIMDKTCLDELNKKSTGRKIGYRYHSLVDATNGIKGSLCAEFGPTMAEISNRIIELTTQFRLNRLPKEDTIQVVVNNDVVPKDLTNGWSYNPVENSIVFHGTFVPAPGSTIKVNFDPLSVK